MSSSSARIDPRASRELARGLGFTESPVWASSRDRLYVSSVNRGAIYEVGWAGTAPLLVAETGGGPSGLARVGEDLLVCQDGGQAMPSRSRLGPPPGIQLVRNGVVSSLVSCPLTSPSDCVIGPDGRLWITDPTGHDLGKKASPGRVWALDLATLALELVLDGILFPNGIEFSPDGRALYVAESATGRVLRHSQTPDGSWVADPWSAPRLDGVPDGLAVDADSHVWVACSFSGAVVRLSPDGALCAHLEYGTRAAPTALCFAGRDLADLIVTSARGGAVLHLPHAAHGTAGRPAFGDPDEVPSGPPRRAGAS